MAKEQTVATETAQSSVDKLLSLLDESKKSAVAEFIGKVGKESQVFKVTGALLDSYIADIDTVLSAQMNQIIHNQDFQELESTWRGLLFLVQNTEFSKPIKFELLDVTKEELSKILMKLQTAKVMKKIPGCGITFIGVLTIRSEATHTHQLSEIFR